MRGILIQDDVKLVESRLKQFERNTGCELLLVVAESSDPYPGASWRFGVLGGFLSTLVFSYYFEFEHAYFWPLSILLLTLFMTWIGHFDWAKRMTLSDIEVDRESFEKALEYFHTLGTTKATHKVTAMIMVSILEKKIQVLIDEELKQKITQKDLNKLIEIMQKHFGEGHMGLGLVQSIQTLEEEILHAFNGKVSDVNPSELKDIIHFV
jgi:uncharacterized membrane protein